MKFLQRSTKRTLVENSWRVIILIIPVAVNFLLVDKMRKHAWNENEMINKTICVYRISLGGFLFVASKSSLISEPHEILLQIMENI